MTQLNLVELAQGGDANAIATLLNQYLQPKGITAKTSRKDDCLKMVLESAEDPEQDYLVAFILSEMICLGVKSVRKVKVYGQRYKTFDPIWHQEFELEKQVQSPSSLQSTDTGTQANSEKEVPRNRVSETEFRTALEECSQTAQKAYTRTEAYTKQAQSILLRLNNNLTIFTEELLRNKDAKRFEFARKLKDIVSEIEYLSAEGIDDLLSSLKIKRNHLEDFTIALFGRTKAGKSTIREALTRGDGGTIGKGSQRTTREVREYRWQGLRLLDTPGIEAYQGQEDTAKAQDVIDQSDMILFLTSDDSVQPGEFSAMGNLQQINKYFAVLLNIKHDISNNSEDLMMFLDLPEIVFDEERIAEHKNHIQTYAKEHLVIENVDIACIHAQSAFLSTIPKYADDSNKLWELSQIEEVYYLITSDIKNNGKKRRFSTFFDGLLNFIVQIENQLNYAQDKLDSQVKFMEEQRKKIKLIFKDTVEQGQKKIKNQCEALYDQIEGRIGTFVENYAENSIYEKKQQWKKLVNKELIEATMKGLIDEIVADLQEELKEFAQQYEYDFKAINIDIDDVNNREFKKSQFGRDMGRLGVAIGAVAGAAFVAVNWWNPAGWVTAAALFGSLGIGSAAEWQKKKDEQDFKNDIEQEKESLRKQVSDKKQKTLISYQTWIQENIEVKFQQKTVAKLDFIIQGLSEIEKNLETSIVQIQKLKEEIKGDDLND